MYGTMADGPGIIAIFDVDPAVAPSIGAIVASSDGVHNFKMVRLFTMEGSDLHSAEKNPASKLLQSTWSVGSSGAAFCAASISPRWAFTTRGRVKPCLPYALRRPTDRVSALDHQGRRQAIDSARTN
jgi:hypothetical protein